METPELGRYEKLDWPAPRKGHAAMIERMDTGIGRILDRLKDLGIDRNTLVLFSSDNGPHQEGGYKPDWNDSNGPLRGIKRDLYEGGIRVPMIAWWPGRIAPRVSDHVGHFADVLLTLAELAGDAAKAATPARLDGISFVPTLFGQVGQATHEYLYWEFFEKKGSRAVRVGNYKGVRVPFDGPIALYDLATDLAEQRNVADQKREVVERIERIMASARTPSEIWKTPGEKVRTGESGGPEE
jgi:arylsulfatase A-like enzyme